MRQQAHLLAVALVVCIGCRHLPNRSDGATRAATAKIVILGGIGGSGGQPSPGEFKPMVAKTDALPINGVAYNLSHQGGYFADQCMDGKSVITDAMVRPDTELMRSFQFRNLTDNFVRLNIAAALTADWFDDAAWQAILAKIAVASRAAKAGGAVGFMLDNEQYNGQPYNYTAQAHRVEKSFDQYREQVRRRGQEFMRALGSALPHPKLLMLYGNAALYTCDPAGKTPLSVSQMGLWPPFLDGMMDADATAEFIDGFEQAYHYRSFAQFAEGREIIKEKAAGFSQDPARYRKRIKVGFGLWLHAMKQGEGKLNTTDFTQNSYTPDEFRHAIHYALRLSDGYIWLYSVPWFSLPAEYLAAVREARQPQALDFQPLKRDEDPRGNYIISAKGRPDCADAVVFAAYRNAGKVELYDFPKTWRFRFDPQDAGIRAKWWATPLDQDWLALEIGDWWEPQLKLNYYGFAWYRFAFDVPAAWQGRKLRLVFGAVDEDAWIWVNGQKAGEHALGPEGWNSAFDLDVTGKLVPGQTNTIAVRVHNSAGVGGIWKSMKLFTDP